MIYGFGTRDVTNTIVKAFLNNEIQYGAKYFPEYKNVLPFEKSQWLGFDKNVWISKKIPIAVVGILRGIEELLWEAKNNNINFYYCDHAYFYRSDEHRTHSVLGDRFYRVVINQENLNYITELSSEDKVRIEKYKSKMPINYTRFIPNTFRKNRSIILCPPSEALDRYYNLGGVDNWIKNTSFVISQYSDRPIIVRKKDCNIPLQEHLNEAYCIVTFQSTIAIQAILQGIHSFCSEVSCCMPVSSNDLRQIETPFYPTKDLIQEWINSLLANQFSLSELRDGLAKEVVNRLQQRKKINYD
jgi:hypothetical protein